MDGGAAIRHAPPVQKYFHFEVFKKLFWGKPYSVMGHAN